MRVCKLIIDVLVPHEPDILTYTEGVTQLNGVETVKLRVEEVDDRTKTIQMTVEGDALRFDDIKSTIEDLGGAIHSIDEVTANASPKEE
ncbi:MAG: DUF211 domain-containing protein [Chloroflexota bacterium]